MNAAPAGHVENSSVTWLNGRDEGAYTKSASGASLLRCSRHIAEAAIPNWSMDRHESSAVVGPQSIEPTRYRNGMNANGQILVLQKRQHLIGCQHRDIVAIRP